MKISSLVHAVLLALALTLFVTAAAAQTSPDTADRAAAVATDEEDDGFDWGLLGLLGLLGLIPTRKRHVDPPYDASRRT